MDESSKCIPWSCKTVIRLYLYTSEIGMRLESLAFCRSFMVTCELCFFSGFKVKWIILRRIFRSNFLSESKTQENELVQAASHWCKLHSGLIFCNVLIETYHRPSGVSNSTMRSFTYNSKTGFLRWRKSSTSGR